jgi:hypothetical protein
VTSTNALRAQLLVATRGLAVVVVLVLLAGSALAGAGWLYTHPETTTVDRDRPTLTVQSSVSTGAVVTRDTRLHDQGQRLADQPVYFLDSMPVANLSLVTTAGEVEATPVSQRLRLRIRATHDGTVFWERARTIASTDGRAGTSAGAVRSNATLDVAALRDRLRDISAAVSDGGSVGAALTYRARYETADGPAAVNDTVPISVDGGTYEFGTGAAEETHTDPVTERYVTARHDAGAAGLALLGLFALGLAVVVNRERELLADRDLGPLRRRIDAERHADWVSRGSLDDVARAETVRLDSLTDLVDVAIDSDRRVVHDPDRGTYAVLVGDTCYRFDYTGRWRYNGPLTRF